MTSPRVVLRVDADATIGVGHAMRSITLGAALAARRFDVRLVSVAIPDPLAARATAAGITVELTDEPSVMDRITDLEPSLVVVDGYHLAPLLGELEARAISHAVIDDNHELPIGGAALVLNQNLHATTALYPDVRPDQQLLLGSRYVLLRPDVARVRRRPPRAVANRVLVALGGADPIGLTGPLAAGLVDQPAFEVAIAVGSANPRRDELRSLASRHHGRVRVDAGDLVDSYRWADVAVIGAGTTMWETGYLGLPALAVIVADNQWAGGRAAAEHGLVEAIDGRRDLAVAALLERCKHMTSDVERRRAMSSAGRGLFDRNGANRVAAAIESLTKRPRGGRQM